MAQREIRVGDHFIGSVCRDDPTTEAVLVLKVPDPADPGVLDCHPMDEGAARDLLALLHDALGIAAPTRPTEINGPALDGDLAVMLSFPDDSMILIPFPPGHDFDPAEVEWSDGHSHKGWRPALAPKEASDAQD